MQKEKNVFEGFTNLYELSKTLRFELKPARNTQKMLEENKVFEKDELIQKKYQETKKYFDRLHREFVKEALENAKLSDLEKYYEALKNVKKITRETANKDRKDLKTILEKEEKRLRKEVVALFNVKAKKWSERYLGLKNKDLKILDEEAVFSAILKERYEKEEKTFLQDDKTKEFILNKKGEKISIFDEWKGFTGYFTKFFETRKNFYKDDGTSTALATRIIDQNLRRFAENIDTIDFIKRNYPDFSFAKIKQEYDFDFYTSHCLLQDGIDDYNKNFVGIIKSEINFYRQKNKGKKVPYLKTLDRQILSEKEKFIDEIENDKRLLKVLNDLLKTGNEKTKVLKSLFDTFVKSQSKFDLTKIYFSKKGFEQISRRWTSETQKWEEKLAEVFKKNKVNLSKRKDAGYSFPDFISLDYLKQSLNLLSQEEKESFWKDKYEVKAEDIWNQFLEIFKLEFDELFEKILQTDKGERTIGYDIFTDNLQKVLKNEKTEKTSEFKIAVKEFADSLLFIYQFSKYFAVEKSKKWDDSVKIDDEFYNHLKYGFFDKYYKNSFEEIITPYNLLRNYLTKKPWESVQKWKLNFENSNLAGGWDKNQETGNFAIILRKNGKYFLGLMKKGCNHLFEDKEKFRGEGYEKMVYKYFPTPSKMIPKTSTQVSEVKKHFKNSKENYFLEESSTLGRFIKPLKITKEVFDLNNFEYKKSYISTLNGKNPDELQRVKADSNKTGQIKLFQKEFLNLSKNEKVYHQSVCCWINFCKEYLKCFPSTGDGFLQFNKYIKNTNEYESIDKFYRNIEQGGYKILFQNISEKYIEDKNKNDELYLFQIKNKDWNKGSTGTKNLHTLYFENLFSDENIAKNFIFKLNGQAEIFYRPKAIEAKKVKRNFTREIIEKKRYTEDKTFFHVPMTVNRATEKTGKGYAYKFNTKINEFLASKPEINIIGVDRGEKHLAYYSVINQESEILESGTLNIIKGGNGKDIDYHQKLEEKAKGREQARIDWQKVEGIKDLKKGYISQVVRKLADLAIEHNAIIVFEDLNMRFKQIRGGIEKSVYQQLEKALIEKLNFLVEKGEKNPKQAGNLLRAYQLTAPFETFQKMGKQTGILFYTQANYTSITDPVSGFRKNIYVNNTASIEKIGIEINKFNEIGWDDNLKSYYFKYDAKEFNRYEKGESKEWTIYADIPRIRREKINGYWDYESVNPNDLLIKLFSDYGIEKNKDIKQQIKNKENKNELGEKEFDGKKRNFYKSLIYILNLILQVRNSFSEKDKDGNEKNYIDFIASPVYPFFATEATDKNRKKLSTAKFDAFEKKFLSNSKDKEKIKKEFNGDANGALNIARKGIIILDRIKKWRKENEELKKEGEKEKFYPDLFISYSDWDKFVQK